MDEDISTTIARLIEAEHQLRAEETRTGRGDASAAAALEVELDRCWDLLRQRRALRSAHQDPSAAQARSGPVVEHYLQ